MSSSVLPQHDSILSAEVCVGIQQGGFLAFLCGVKRDDQVLGPSEAEGGAPPAFCVLQRRYTICSLFSEWHLQVQGFLQVP